MTLMIVSGFVGAVIGFTLGCAYSVMVTNRHLKTIDEDVKTLHSLESDRKKRNGYSWKERNETKG